MLYYGAVESTGPEHAALRLGEFEAWNLKVTVTDPTRASRSARTSALWISTDARRLPLKLQADLPVGNFALALREVDNDVPTRSSRSRR